MEDDNNRGVDNKWTRKQALPPLASVTPRGFRREGDGQQKLPEDWITLAALLAAQRGYEAQQCQALRFNPGGDHHWCWPPAGHDHGVVEQGYVNWLPSRHSALLLSRVLCSGDAARQLGRTLGLSCAGRVACCAREHTFTLGVPTTERSRTTLTATPLTLISDQLDSMRSLCQLATIDWRWNHNVRRCLTILGNRHCVWRGPRAGCTDYQHHRSGWLDGCRPRGLGVPITITSVDSFTASSGAEENDDGTSSVGSESDLSSDIEDTAPSIATIMEPQLNHYQRWYDTRTTIPGLHLRLGSSSRRR